ncbi:MAG: sugar phosphate isomerase/epimerase [Planctomycetes bacterium]|nr:sugar phosphate isomerase/epimerase [Planctomycetota bacterium]
MKFAICNETFEGGSHREGLALAKKLGYTGVEVAPFTLGLDVREIRQGTRREYRAMVEDLGMSILGLHWLLAKTSGFHLTTDDAAVRSKTADYFKSLIELCVDLGGNIMVLGSPLQRNFSAPLTHDQAMGNAIDVIGRLTSDLESANVRLAIEPLGPQEGNFLNHASQARVMIQRIASPNVRLHLDVKAMSSEGFPIAQIIQDHADLLIHFHANDPNKLGPGMGDVDQAPIFKALKDVGYSGWVSVEVFDYSPGVEQILTASMDTMVRCAALASGSQG